MALELVFIRVLESILIFIKISLLKEKELFMNDFQNAKNKKPTDFVSDFFADFVELVNNETNTDAGDDVVLQIVKKYGGMNLYIPKEDKFFREKRDSEIYQKYNGLNLKQLAQEYGVTEQTIRNIVKNKTPAQKGLFDDF